MISVQGLGALVKERWAEAGALDPGFITGVEILDVDGDDRLDVLQVGATCGSCGDWKTWVRRQQADHAGRA